MRTYRIPVFWSVGGIIKIKAESLEEAIADAADDTDPRRADDQCYIDMSMQLDIDGALEMNNEEGTDGET